MSKETIEKILEESVNKTSAEFRPQYYYQLKQDVYSEVSKDIQINNLQEELNSFERKDQSRRSRIRDAILLLIGFILAIVGNFIINYIN